MGNNRILKYSECIFTGLFSAGIFIFFYFFYNSHLHFEEQTQLFLLTGYYFASKIIYPGGFSGYLGEFLTQFYYLSFAGPLVIMGLLSGIQRIFRLILKKINENDSYFPLSFLPSLNCAVILCDEFYPLSAVTGLLTALFLAWIYMTVKIRNRRFVTGLVFIPVSYWLAGGSFMTFILIITIYELITSRIADRITKTGKQPVRIERGLKVWHLAIFALYGAGLPLFVGEFLIMQPMMLSYFSEFYYDLRTTVPVAIPGLLSLPAIVMIMVFMLPSKAGPYYHALSLQLALMPLFVYFGLRQWANFDAEKIMRYDYLVRNERWNDVIKFAEKNPPRNNLSLAMLNLSLAMTDKMGDQMFRFGQNGASGLFLSFEREYVAPMMGSEIFFHLGLVNASQEYSFESMETIPDFSKSARCMKRLAETNLINGDYEVSRKYLRLLKQTIFYRKWAKDTGKYLHNEESINNHSVWGEKRNTRIKEDFFFKVENMESALNMLLRDNPHNRVAFQYLMAFYLINKDLGNFMRSLPRMKPMEYDRIPVAWEEAIMYVVGLSTTNLEADIPFNISRDTKVKMKAYADIYTTYPNAKPILERRFPETYWYYLHYKPIEINQ